MAEQYRFDLRASGVELTDPNAASSTVLDAIDEVLCSDSNGIWSGPDLGASGLYCDCGPSRGWSAYGCTVPGSPPPFDGSSGGHLQQFQDTPVLALPASPSINANMANISDAVFTFYASSYNVPVDHLDAILCNPAALARFGYDLLYNLEYDPAAAPAVGHATVSVTTPATMIGALEASMNLQGADGPTQAQTIDNGLTVAIQSLLSGAIFSTDNVQIYLLHRADHAGHHADGVFAVNPQGGVVRAISAISSP